VAANVPCGPLRSVDDLLHDPQLASRRMLRPSGEDGGILYAGNPVKLSGMDDPPVAPAAPALDHDRARILNELGLADG
jgi:CoA:oxalate CoA-transferase